MKNALNVVALFAFILVGSMIAELGKTYGWDGVGFAAICISVFTMLAVHLQWWRDRL